MRWRGLLAGVTALVCALGCSSDDDAPTGPIGFSVSAYDVSADLESEVITVAADIQVDVAGDCLTLPMRATPRTGSWNEGDFLDLTVEGDRVTMCGEGVEVGEPLRIVVEAELRESTWSNTQVGYSVTTDIEGQPFRYLVSWVGGCDRFGPCDSAPDRFARHRFEVRHAASERVLCPGSLREDSGLTICEADFAAPTYSGFGFAASPSWTEVKLGTWGGLDVTFFDMPSSATAARVQTEVHDQFVAWMVDNFGAYAYGDTLRLAVGPTVWNGFEHPGNILLNDDLRNDVLAPGYEDKLTHVINHEIAHMWAGNRTTLADVRSFVWKEAVVEYLGFVFEDEVLGGATADITARAWKSFARNPEYYPVPTDEVPLVDFYGDAYGPGPMILFRQLEALYGRQPVLAAVSELLAPGAVSIEDVQAALEAQLDVDLTGYLADWLIGSGTPEWPRFTVSFDQVADQVTVEVTQVSPADLRGCAFAVELRGASDDERAEVWIDRGLDGQQVVTAVATVPFTVVETRIDPHAHALAYLPAASSGPRIHPWRADGGPR